MDGLIEKVFQAGVVGCGGAGFPTHVKLARQAAWFIVNGVECEPLLRTDRHVMLAHPGELIETIDAIARHLGADRYGIAVKHSYVEEIAALERAIRELGSKAAIFQLDHFYPAGDEQVIVQQVTGLTVPPGGIPLDVGVVMSNAATVMAVHDALAGRPFTHKVLTVAGAVNKPVVVRVPLGTPLTECLSLAGGAAVEDYRLIVGGPMMGKPIGKEDEEQAVVIKTTSGVLAVPGDGYLARLPEINVPHTVNRARSACIQCSFCTMMCPRYLIGHPLQPHLIMRKLAYGSGLDGILDDPDVRQALICCECGICELYACPMSLQPRRVNVLLKRKLAEAGIRYERTGDGWNVRAEFDNRKVPTKRITARVGMGKYYGVDPDRYVDYAPDRVCIPLRQHIGVPSVPLVKPGSRVKTGQLIARCPDGQLGANLHASIDGRVVKVGEYIVIEKA